MKMNTCESCKFFEQTNPKAGICRRLPPSPFPTGPDQVSAFWPPVQLHHWCGEWAHRLVIASELPSDPRQLVQ